MLNRWKKQLEQFHMIDEGDRILVGCSGGADSICLLQMLYLLRNTLSLKIGAVYCNHGIRREEAVEDGRFVEAFCKERQISYYEAFQNVTKRAKDEKLTVEEAGRQFRYETFARIMEEDGYDKVAVAHNANDRAETMLFHLARGTGISGLCTMDSMRSFSEGKMLIRPLLFTQRKDIEAWLLKQGLSWRTDCTNFMDIYTRNQIRHKILPMMEKINEKAVVHMCETAEKLKEASDYLKEEEDKIWTECVKWLEKERKAIIDLSVLEKYHDYMIKTLLYRVLSEVMGTKKDIATVHVDMLFDLYKGGSGREVSLGKQVYGYKKYDELIVFFKKNDTANDQKWKGSTVIEKTTLEKLKLQTEIIDFTGQEISKNEYTKCFDCDKIKNSVVLRCWQEGDYIFLKEDGGRKKLNRYFIDEKIPPEKRRQIPLLADGAHVMWIVGHRISAYYKVTEQTRRVFVASVENKG